MKEYNDYLSNLKTLISFKSMQTEAKENMPFGEENFKALNFTLELAKSWGFDTVNYDNYAGEISIGKGEEVGIMGHLDVVPPSSGWNSDPFTLTVKDGKLIARGIEDDKGPTLLCLYALKELKDKGVEFNRKIRLFLGCNEETGWKDLEYLSSKTTMPEYGFSPDGDFPVMYAEKGVYYLVFHLPEFKSFSSLQGGTVINAVCADASVVSEIDIDDNLINKYGLTVNGNVISSKGITAHGSCPQNGVNAFLALFSYMKDMGENFGDFIDCAFLDKQKIFDLKTEQGLTTLSPNLIKKTDGGYDLYCDVRLPAPLNIQTLVPLLDKFGFSYTLTEKHPPMMVEKEGWLVTALSNAYASVTGKMKEPESMGGSTFARAFKKGCAFGICEGDYSGGAHKANEYITEDWIKKAYQIYYNAIFNIVK